LLANYISNRRHRRWRKACASRASLAAKFTASPVQNPVTPTKKQPILRWFYLDFGCFVMQYAQTAHFSLNLTTIWPELFLTYFWVFCNVRCSFGKRKSVLGFVECLQMIQICKKVSQIFLETRFFDIEMYHVFVIY